MGIFKSIVKTAGYGGDKVCKYCGEKKTVMSTAACDKGPSGKPKPHVWVDPATLR